MVEVIVAMVLLSALLGGVLSAVEMSARTQRGTQVRLMAVSLASDLMEEVCGTAYWDPDLGGGFGVGADEDPSDRSTFDDVDDYYAWVESPPTFRDGTPIPGAEGWTRRVIVRWVDPADPSLVVWSETGVKLVVVRAERDGVVYSELSRLRTRALDAAQETGG